MKAFQSPKAMPPPKRGSFQNPKSSIKKQQIVEKENKTPAAPEPPAQITMSMSEFKNSNHIEIFGKSNGSLIDMMKMKKQ